MAKSNWWLNAIGKSRGTPIPSGQATEAYFASNGQLEDRPALRLYEKLISRYSEGVIVDWGCGSGSMLKRLSHYGSVIGYDVSPAARELANSLIPRATIVSEPSAIESGSVDAIIALHVLEHVDDAGLEVTFMEWLRILKPWGVLLVATPDLDGKGAKIKGADWVGLSDPSHTNLKGADAWRMLFLSKGFELIEEGSDGLWDGPYTTSLRLERFVRLIPSAVAVLIGRLISRVGSGESYISIWRVLKV